MSGNATGNLAAAISITVASNGTGSCYQLVSKQDALCGWNMTDIHFSPHYSVEYE